MDAIQGFWTRRGETEQIIRHTGAPRPDAFREHPIWLSVLPLLLGPSTRPLRVADIGCGTGIMAEHAARLGHKVIAIDFAATRVAVARERLAPFPGAEIRLGDAYAPPLDPGEVDVIISRNLLWLLKDPVAAVAGWGRLVSPGGRVAAVDASFRLHRRWDIAPPQGIASEAQQNPLADCDGAPAAGTIWAQAGLREVDAVPMDWVTAAKLAHATSWTRAMNRSAYYLVGGRAA